MWEEVKNGIRNREVRELICTTHGHEARGGILEGWGVQGRGRIKGQKKSGKFDGIINKICLKKKS